MRNVAPLVVDKADGRKGEAGLEILSAPQAPSDPGNDEAACLGCSDGFIQTTADLPELLGCTVESTRLLVTCYGCQHCPTLSVQVLSWPAGVELHPTGESPSRPYASYM